MLGNGIYRPVWRALPSQPEWQRIPTDSVFEPSTGTQWKLSWVFEHKHQDNELYFAFAPPFPYQNILRSADFFESVTPRDASFYRETLVHSLDGRKVELLTLSNAANFTAEREESLESLFPTKTPRCFKATKPVVFVSARVHPAETPASFMLEGLMKALFSTDRRGALLRKHFVFKIVPVLNPDGVSRGYYRVDQNGVNLNRCYVAPSADQFPTIYAAKTYLEYLAQQDTGVLVYLDLHAHPSRKGCFLFGNSLPPADALTAKLFGRLVTINSGYYNWNDCDFSEYSMKSRDPGDHQSKEGSGRVAMYRHTGIVCSYTVEAAYYLPKALHTLSPLVHVATGRSCVESACVRNNPNAIRVYNRPFFDEIGEALVYSLLDFCGLSRVSRVPSSHFSTLDKLKDALSKPQSTQFRKVLSVQHSKKSFAPHSTVLPKVHKREVHKMTIISPTISDRFQTKWPVYNLKKMRPRSMAVGIFKK